MRDSLQTFLRCWLRYFVHRHTSIFSPFISIVKGQNQNRKRQQQQKLQNQQVQSCKGAKLCKAQRQTLLWSGRREEKEKPKSKLQIGPNFQSFDRTQEQDQAPGGSKGSNSTFLIMGKLYYCDYCDRSFIDDFQARKKHLKGIAHLRSRKLHYSSCRDLETLVEEESNKEECFKFKNSGQCQFGDDCYRSHFSKQQLDLFRKRIHEEKSRKIFQEISELKTVESWLTKRNTISPFQVTPDEKTSHINYTSYEYLPQHANMNQNLPLSVQPFRVSDFKDAEVAEWG